MSTIPDDYTLPAADEALLAECDVHVFRGTGPGGQSVNTTDSAVRLVHRPTGMVVVCRRERSQLRNKNECIKRLRAKIAEEMRPVAERIKTRPSRAAVARRLDAKTRVSAKKRARRKPTEE